MSQYTMTIDGRPASSPGALKVINPATGEVFAEVPDCTREQLDVAMQAAQRAFSGWKDDYEQRRAVMYACADALEANAEELGRLATMEQGMPLAAGVGSIRGAASNFRYYADLDIPRITVQDDDAALVEIVRRPIGVIAAIKPWNVPIGMAVNTIAPAFRAGCTVVLKPSPFTPVVTVRMGEVLRDLVPAGVLNIVSGGNELGQWMTEHPIPRGVSFTGSIATGKKVNVSAAADLKRVLLELGGNDAAIVLDDADPADVAEKLFWPAFRNSGQICMAVKRVFVPEQLEQQVVEALAAKARSVKVGNGLDEGVELGPINNEPQFERVKGLVAEAIADGAVAVAGGHPIEGDGYFFEPTILTGVAEGTRIVDEEQFGPALPILTYRTVPEAIGRANATNYGLGASVWSSDPLRAAEVAEKLEAGTVWINTHMQLTHDAPFTGMKWSGLGSEMGLWSIYAYTDPQTVFQTRSQVIKKGAGQTAPEAW
jgi:acyl-CoA reductase-like NAD-dependent aldehyde dehydrogenase